MLNITEQIYAENLIWICINKFIKMSTKSYYLYIKQFSHDGTNWINVQPLTYSYDGDGTMTPVVKEEHDAACGAMPPIYQWVDTEETVCVYEGHDYSREYLTFESLEDNNVIYWYAQSSEGAKTISASTDNGATWTAYTSTESGTTIATLNTGDKVFLKGENTTYASYGYNKFGSSRRYNVYGNIMSLTDGDNFIDATTVGGWSLGNIFYESSGLTSAENLILPATTLGDYCYGAMFLNCTNLTTAPELPATTISRGCYSTMFQGCTSLTVAPELPATTMKNSCYSNMFHDCTSLTVAPELPATTLAHGCYNAMFAYCTSLTTAPVLSATTLDHLCYAHMFEGCTSLTVAPELPATTLVGDCYFGMFVGCTGLTTAPILSASTITSSNQWRDSGGNIRYVGAYQDMFKNCTNITSITCLATDISAINCTNNWVKNVSATGTFTKPSSMNSWGYGVNGIPSGWTVQNV